MWGLEAAADLAATNHDEGLEYLRRVHTSATNPQVRGYLIELLDELEHPSYFIHPKVQSKIDKLLAELKGI